MARTGRPKAEKPFDHKVTVKFNTLKASLQGSCLQSRFCLFW